MKNAPLSIDINHLHGQLIGQRALIRAIAGALMSKDHFREVGLAQLERTRTAFLASQAPEATPDGIDAVETWLLTVTEEARGANQP